MTERIPPICYSFLLFFFGFYFISCINRTGKRNNKKRAIEGKERKEKCHQRSLAACLVQRLAASLAEGSACHLSIEPASLALRERAWSRVCWWCSRLLLRVAASCCGCLRRVRWVRLLLLLLLWSLRVRVCRCWRCVRVCRCWRCVRVCRCRRCVRVCRCRRCVVYGRRCTVLRRGGSLLCVLLRWGLRVNNWLLNDLDRWSLVNDLRLWLYDCRVRGLNVSPSYVAMVRRSVHSRSNSSSCRHP